MKDRILFVDDDPNILAAHQRSLRRNFDLTTAEGGKAGLDQIRGGGPFAVVLSDMRMPGMDGVEFLQHVRKIAPNTVRIMLTGNADVETAMLAVNHGHIFRFLTKPTEPEELIAALSAGVEQHRLITAEKQLLEGTLKGSIRAMTEVLSLVNPLAFGRAARLKRSMSFLVSRLELPNAWSYELAAMLSQIGCVVLPPELINKVYAGEELTEDEQKSFAAHPTMGARLMSSIPRLEMVSKMIARQMDGCSWPQHIELRTVEGDALGGHLLRICIDFDQWTLQGTPATTAIERLRADKLTYHPEIVDALETMANRPQEFRLATLKVDQLACRMILDQDVLSLSGMLLVARGQEITYAVLAHLRRWVDSVGVQEPIRVQVPR